jgi:serine protease AprX
MNPQPTFTWSVSGGGSIDQNGLFTAGSTAGGPFTVTAAGGGKTGTASVTVTGGPTPDFSLSVSPASQTVPNGSTVQYTVTINPSNGFNSSVTLSLSGYPAGATVSFSPNPSTNTSTLTIVTPSQNGRKNYLLTITGQSGSLTHSTTVQLTTTQK